MMVCFTPAKFQVPKPRPTDYCDPLLINICGPTAIVNSASARLQLIEGDLRHTGQQRHLGEACLHQPLAHGPHRRIGWIGESGRQQMRMTPAERTDSEGRNQDGPRRIASHHDGGPHVGADPDMALPGCELIEALKDAVIGVRVEGAPIPLDR
jgi:hypothetical protein